jgi:hypothetical protein
MFMDIMLKMGWLPLIPTLWIEHLLSPLWDDSWKPTRISEISGGLHSVDIGYDKEKTQQTRDGIETRIYSSDLEIVV